MPVADDEQAKHQTTDVLSTCRLEAEVLLAFALGKNQSWLYAWPEQGVTANQVSAYRQLLAERCRGKPVAYLTGWQEFWSMNFSVSSAVLIPRPDTELLVEIAINYLSTPSAAEQSLVNNTLANKNSPRVLELGTGSGAIAIALASELANADITATDISEPALDVARNNAKRLLQQRNSQITFVQSDWFQKLQPANTEAGHTSCNTTNGYQLILSNPPYIRADDPHLITAVTGIGFEPRSALVAHDNGLQALQEIIDNALVFLADGAMLALEHGHDQAEDVRELLRRAGYLSIETRTDLSGVERVTLGHRPNVKL